MPITPYNFDGVGVHGGGFVSAGLVLSTGRLVAGIDVGGLYYSDDEGGHWFGAMNGLAEQQHMKVTSLYEDPDDSSVLYGAAGNFSNCAFLKSTDGGETWTRLNTNDTEVRFDITNNKSPGARYPGAPDQHPRFYGRLIAKKPSSSVIWISNTVGKNGSTEYGVMRSTTGGTAGSWTSIGLNASYYQYIRSLVYHPGLGYLFAGLYKATDPDTSTTYKGVYVCKNPEAGTPTWTLCTGTNAPNYGEELMVLGDTLYAVCDHEGVRRVPITSGVDTATWTNITGSIAVGNGPPDDTTKAGPWWLSIGGRVNSGDGKHHVLVGSFQPAKNGATGNYLNVYETTDALATSVTWDALSDATPNTAVGGDGEQWWLTLPTGEPRTMPNGSTYIPSSLGYDPDDSDLVFAFGRSGVWRCKRATKTWDPMVRHLYATINYGIDVDPADGDNVWWANSDWTIFRSLDKGVSVSMDGPDAPVGYDVQVDDSESPSRIFTALGHDRLNQGGRVLSKLSGTTVGPETWTEEFLFGGSRLLDTFTRTTGSGTWGTANSGGEWTLSNSALQVADNVGKITVTGGASGVGLNNRLPDHAFQHSNGTMIVEFSQAAAGNFHGIGFIIRALTTDTSIYYYARLRQGSNGTWRMAVFAQGVTEGSTSNPNLNPRAWSSSDSYLTGDIVTHHTTKAFEALVDNSNVEPPSSGSSSTWSLVSGDKDERDLTFSIAAATRVVLTYQTKAITGGTRIVFSMYVEGDPEKSASWHVDHTYAGSPLHDVDGTTGVRFQTGSNYSGTLVVKVDDFDATGSSGTAATGNRPLGIAVCGPESGNGNERVLVAAIEPTSTNVGGGLRRKKASLAGWSAGTWSAVANTGGANEPLAQSPTSKLAMFDWPGNTGSAVYLFDRKPGAVFRSNDYGATWTRIVPASEMSGYTDSRHSGFVAGDPTTTGRLYVAWNSGIMRLESADTGTALPGGTITRTDLSVDRPGPIAVDDNGRLYVVSLPATGTAAKLMASDDAGATFDDISDSFFKGVLVTANDMAVGPDQSVFITTQGQGVIRSTATIAVTPDVVSGTGTVGAATVEAGFIDLSPDAVVGSGVVPDLVAEMTAEMSPPSIGGVATAHGDAELFETIRVDQTLDTVGVAGEGIVEPVEFRLVFRPPTVQDVPPFHTRTRGLQLALARWLPSGSRGVNVFLLTDDTVTENQPADPTLIRKVFHGGHVNPVTESERLLLEAAGYVVTWPGP